MKLSHRHFIAFAVVSITAGIAACSGADPAPAPGPTGPSNPTGTTTGTPTGTSTGTSPTGTPTGTSTGTPTKKKFGQQCTKSSDCESDFCVFLSGGSSLGMCTQTCDDDIDCPGFDNKCVKLSDAPQKVCVPK